MAKEEQARRALLFGPDRFRMKNGEKREIVTVDEAGDGYYEHEFKGPNGWTRITCDTRVQTPKCCVRLGRSRTKTSRRNSVYAYTVVDCQKWTDRSGKERQYEMKLFPAKFRTNDTIIRKRLELKEEGETWAGSIVIARRYGDDKSPSVGSEHERKRAVDLFEVFQVANYAGKPLSRMWDEAEADEKKMQALKDLFQVEFDPESDGKRLLRKVVPFNYEKVLAPPPEDLLDEIIGFGPTGDSTSSSEVSNGGGGAFDASDADADDIPF